MANFESFNMRKPYSTVILFDLNSHCLRLVFMLLHHTDFELLLKHNTHSNGIHAVESIDSIDVRQLLSFTRSTIVFISVLPNVINLIVK